MSGGKGPVFFCVTCWGDFLDGRYIIWGDFLDDLGDIDLMFLDAFTMFYGVFRNQKNNTQKKQRGRPFGLCFSALLSFFFKNKLFNFWVP